MHAIECARKQKLEISSGACAQHLVASFLELGVGGAEVSRWVMLRNRASLCYRRS